MTLPIGKFDSIVLQLSKEIMSFFCLFEFVTTFIKLYASLVDFLEKKKLTSKYRLPFNYSFDYFTNISDGFAVMVH